jgi:hypothetical protein
LILHSANVVVGIGRQSSAEVTSVKRGRGVSALVVAIIIAELTNNNIARRGAMN